MCEETRKETIEAFEYGIRAAKLACDSPTVLMKTKDIKNGLDLLKAQEPKTVQIISTVGVSDILFADCPWCGARIHDNESQNYCGHCGKAVKWNE